MTTQESTPPDTQADSPGAARTGPNWGRVISLFAWLGFLGFAAVVCGRTSTRAWPTRTSRGGPVRSSS